MLPSAHVTSRAAMILAEPGVGVVFGENHLMLLACSADE